MPLDHPFYKNFAWVNFDECDSFSFTNVENLISSFGCLHAKLLEEPTILNTKAEESMDYQSFTQEQIPSDTGLQKMYPISVLSYGMF